MSTTAVPRSAIYLGADSSGAEFWLSGPHVFSVPAEGRRDRHVCSVARFNRLRCCTGTTRTVGSPDPFPVRG